MSHESWLKQAESDLMAAKLLSSQAHHSQAVWLTAQAVEKAHKAILAALGLRYEDKHYKKLGHDTNDISKLLPEALHEPLDPEIARLLATLTSRSEASRYPTGIPLIAPSDTMTTSEQDIKDGEKLIDWCKKRIERALRSVDAMKPTL